MVKRALLERPLPRRNPFVFYWGHLPVFAYLTLAKVCHKPPLSTELLILFARGIDPTSDAEASALQPIAWPSADLLASTIARLDHEVEEMLDLIASRAIAEQQLAQIEAAYTILEHESMHQETLLYLITALANSKKDLRGFTVEPSRPTSAISQIIRIPAGSVTLGAEPDAVPFGWDNEFSTQTVQVPDFLLDSLPITNRQYLDDVERGIAPPWNWVHANNAWELRTPFGSLPLPMDWPVYVSPFEAQAFAHRRGARLMTEAEFHRAAYGTPDGSERLYPWGDAAPGPEHSNSNFLRSVPEAVGLSPAGASAWHIAELVGNGWEITSSPFRPLPGFTPMASYPQYSADFFDDQHLIVKGSSPATALTLIRRSFRNWFFQDYPYAFTKFRLAYDG